MVKEIKLYNNFKIKKLHQKSILLIGNFDGFHLGHQKLFKLAKQYKKKNKIKFGVVTFDPIPKMFFNKNLKNYRISNLNQKIKYFKNYDVDFVIIKKFNKQFSKIKSLNFIEQILYKKLNAKYIFVSNNFRFGNKREGDVELLKSLEKKFQYKIIKPKPLRKKNKIISSTLIRKLLSNGNLDKANKYLNRNWSIEGLVQKGRMMGKKIGFPTCNIELKKYVISNAMKYRTFYILLINNIIIGGVNIDKIQDKTYLDIEWADCGDKFLVVHRLAASEEYWNKGIGQKLMCFAESLVKKNKLNSIRLDTYSSNPIAINFYLIHHILLEQIH